MKKLQEKQGLKKSIKSSMNCHRFVTTDTELALMGGFVFEPQKALSAINGKKNQNKKAGASFH